MSEAPIDCRQVLRDLERYLDGELPRARLDELREHLAACYPCADRTTFHEQIRALVRDGCAEQAPARLVARIRQQLSLSIAGEEPLG